MGKSNSTRQAEWRARRNAKARLADKVLAPHYYVNPDGTVNHDREADWPDLKLESFPDLKLADYGDVKLTGFDDVKLGDHKL